MTSYISTRAQAYGRSNKKPATKHIVAAGNMPLCWRTLSDPYRVSSTSEHRLCPKCETLAR